MPKQTPTESPNAAEFNRTYEPGNRLRASTINALLRQASRSINQSVASPLEATEVAGGRVLRDTAQFMMPFWAIIKDHSAAGSYRGSDGAFSWIAAERSSVVSGRMDWREIHGLKGLHGGPWPAKAHDGRDYVPPGTVVLLYPQPNNQEMLFQHFSPERFVLDVNLGSGQRVNASPWYMLNGVLTELTTETIQVGFPSGRGAAVGATKMVWCQWLPDVDHDTSIRGYWDVISAEC